MWSRGVGTPSEMIDQHIQDLHEYNDIKDAGQVILGKVRTKEDGKARSFFFVNNSSRGYLRYFFWSMDGSEALICETLVLFLYVFL